MKVNFTNFNIQNIKGNTLDVKNGDTVVFSNSNLDNIGVIEFSEIDTLNIKDLVVKNSKIEN